MPTITAPVVGLAPVTKFGPAPMQLNPALRTEVLPLLFQARQYATGNNADVVNTNTVVTGTVHSRAPIIRTQLEENHFYMQFALPIDSIVAELNEHGALRAHNSIWFLNNPSQVTVTFHKNEDCVERVDGETCPNPQVFANSQNLAWGTVPLAHELSFILRKYAIEGETNDIFYRFESLNNGENQYLNEMIAEVLTHEVNAALFPDRPAFVIHPVIAQKFWANYVMRNMVSRSQWENRWQNAVNGRVSAVSRTPIRRDALAWTRMDQISGFSMDREWIQAPAANAFDSISLDLADVVQEQDSENSDSQVAQPRVLNTLGMVPPVLPAESISHSELFPTEPEAIPWVEDFSHFKKIYRSVEGVEHPEAMAKIPDTFSFVKQFRGAQDQYVPSTFGIEIEIDFPNEPTSRLGASKRALANRLHAEHLTFYDANDSDPERWHQAGRRENPDGSYGYTNARNGWSVEFDRSVDPLNGARGCEIVSPILYNTVEAWQDINDVLTAIKELGGETTLRTGLHVNIGNQQFNTTASMTNMGEILRISNQFDDVLIRLAHTPEIGQIHRGRAYCTPSVPTEHSNYTDRELRDYLMENGHRSVINFANAQEQRGRIEFRIFDGTLDLGRMQANVMLALAITRACGPTAFRLWDREQAGEQAGTHLGRATMNRRRPRRLEGQEWRENTLRVRQLLKTLHLQESEAKALITMYRASRWMIH